LSSEQLPAIFTTDRLAWQNPQSRCAFFDLVKMVRIAYSVSVAQLEGKFKRILPSGYFHESFFISP
jgi:hypothetical protein